MALIMMIMLTFGLIMWLWSLATSAESRTKLANEFHEDPPSHLFVLAQLFFGYMFFIGILVPIFGEGEFFKSGWPIWQVGGIGSLLLWVISWFWKT